MNTHLASSVHLERLEFNRKADQKRFDWALRVDPKAVQAYAENVRRQTHIEPVRNVTV